MIVVYGLVNPCRCPVYLYTPFHFRLVMKSHICHRFTKLVTVTENSLWKKIQYAYSNLLVEILRHKNALFGCASFFLVGAQKDALCCCFFGEICSLILEETKSPSYPPLLKVYLRIMD